MARHRPAPYQTQASLTYGLFLAIPILCIAVFYIYPVVDTVITSFQNWDGLSPHRRYAGWRNYLSLFNQDRFLNSLLNNLRWLIFYVIAPTTAGLCLALLVNRLTRAEGLFKVIYFLPFTIPPVAVAAIWRWLYEPSAGLITSVLDIVGLGFLAQNWLGNPSIVTYSIMGAALWWSTGFSFIIFYAGLQNLPQELIEAARIDGASAWQTFWKITFPLLWPSTAIALGLSSVDAMRLFDIVWAMTAGGPAYSSDVLATQMYDVAFGRLNMGEASAIAVCLFIIAALIVMPFVVYMASRVEEVRE